MKRVFRVLLCTLLITCCFLELRSFSLQKLMGYADYGLQAAAREGEIDSLFIGSSMFKQGIDGNTVFEDPRQSYLLAYNGNQPCMEAFELEWLISHGVEIDTLYLDMYAYSALQKPTLSDVSILQGLSLQEQLELYQIFRESGDYRMKELFDMVIQANNQIFLAYPLYMPLVNGKTERGFTLTHWEGSTRETLDAVDVSTFQAEFPRLESVQRESLETIISLCAENQIRLVFVETPKYFRLYRQTNYLEVMSVYAAFAAEHGCSMILSEPTAEAAFGQTQGPGFVSYSFETDVPKYFRDMIHLSSEGKNRFSAVLGEAAGMLRGRSAG